MKTTKFYGPPGCLSADTVIEINRCKKSFKIKIKDLVHRFNGGWIKEYKGHYWDLTKPTMIRSRDDSGNIILSKLSHAIYSGKKQTYIIKTDGNKSIRATEKHPFLTPDGWKQLHTLNVGDDVYVSNDQYVSLKHSNNKNKRSYQYKEGLEYHPFAGRRERKTYPYHRLVKEAELSGIDVEDFIERCRNGNIISLVFIDPSLVAVHHVDGDIKNNDKTNLMALKHNDHWALEGKQKTWQNVTHKTKTEKIVSIDEYEIEDTYDLTMDDYPHNFLANGFVVHNTGKTTTLINLVNKEINDNGINIHNIGYLGFTNSACNEASSRVALVGKDNWFRTIHSSCLYLLRRNGLDLGVVTYRHRTGFCKDFGLKYSSDTTDIEYGDVMPEGNVFFSIMSYLKNAKLDPAEWEYTPYSEDFKRPFMPLYDEWTSFKEDCNLIDFDDMLTKTLEFDIPFPSKVLFVDEFQDISPLQYDVVKHFMRGKERVYISGDDDQAIYRFQAASPDIFLNMKSDESSVLPKSFRLKRNVLDISNKLISQNKNRQVKTFLPVGEGGIAKVLYHPKDDEIVREISGKTFLLFRTNSLVEKFSWSMARYGIPFKYLDEGKENMWGWSNKTKSEMYHSLYNKYSYWESLNRMVDSGKLSSGYANYLRLYISKYRKAINPDDINVFMGTIHSAKGREADTVILFDSITPKVLRGITASDSGLDDERRVFYVGMTRAKEKLVIAHSAFPRGMSLELPKVLGVEKL